MLHKKLSDQKGFLHLGFFLIIFAALGMWYLHHSYASGALRADLNVLLQDAKGVFDKLPKGPNQ